MIRTFIAISVVFSMLSPAFAEDSVEELPEVVAAIHQYRVTNETAKSVYTRVLNIEFEKACKAGNLDAAQAIKEEIDNVAATQHELKSCVVSSKKIAVARKTFEKAFNDNHKDFATSLESITAEYTKKQDLETAAKVREYAKSNPYSADARPWIYLFDGTEESYLRNWCQHPEFKVENGMLCGPNMRFSITKSLFNNFVLDCSFSTKKTATILYRCVDLRYDIRNWVCFENNIFSVKDKNSKTIFERKIPCESARITIISKNGLVHFYFNDEILFQMQEPANQAGSIAIEGCFSSIRIKDANQSER